MKFIKYKHLREIRKKSCEKMNIYDKIFFFIIIFNIIYIL